MSGPRKIVLNKTVLFITASVEEGLPFASNPLVELLLWSCLARAQFLYPVRVCHFLMEPNHIHMLVVVDNPDDIKGFMGRFKTESAHAINRLLGKSKRTVWCEGYDAPVLLTADDVRKKIVYIYTNPVKDDLEETVESYPGISSWRLYQSSNRIRKCTLIRRSKWFELKSASNTAYQWKALAKHMRKGSKLSHNFKLHPDAWMECFPHDELEEANKYVFDRIKEVEEDCADTRKRKGRTVVGAAALRAQPIDKPYQSTRSGRRMWCISHDKILRKRFIKTIKAIINQASEVYEEWKNGNLSLPYPIGLYPPALPKNVEMYTPNLLA